MWVKSHCAAASFFVSDSAGRIICKSCYFVEVYEKKNYGSLTQW